MATLGTCQAEGCSAPRANWQFMCLPHWRKVPKALRDDIWRAYKAWKRARTGAVAPKAYLRLSRELREAHERAIAAVREKEIKRDLQRNEAQHRLIS